MSAVEPGKALSPEPDRTGLEVYSIDHPIKTVRLGRSDGLPLAGTKHGFAPIIDEMKARGWNVLDVNAGSV